MYQTVTPEKKKIGSKPFPGVAKRFADVLFHEEVHAIPNLCFSELLWLLAVVDGAPEQPGVGPVFLKP